MGPALIVFDREALEAKEADTASDELSAGLTPHITGLEDARIWDKSVHEIPLRGVGLSYWDFPTEPLVSWPEPTIPKSVPPGDIRCPRCLEPKPAVKRRRLNTAYENDESNFLASCKECYDEVHAAYEEQWEEYYSGRL